MDKRTCKGCEYNGAYYDASRPCMWCGDNHEYYRPETTTEDLIEMYEIKQRAEKDYQDAVFAYANCPVGTAGRNEAYNRIWILSNVLGYSEEKVEKDMQEAEDEQG